jgi:hypothetical protein
MDLVNPGLAWFAAGMAIPIIIHLLHRQRFRRERWAAMQFLLNAIRKTQRRIRLENLILLLIRMLIMGFLAMAIARPFLKESPLAALADSNTNYIFVIDQSMSMGYKKAQATQLEVAKRSAVEVLDQLNLTGDNKFTLILMSQFPEIRLPSVSKRDVAKAAIQEIELSDYGTRMYETFQVIGEAIENSPNVEKKVYIFSDLQENAWAVETEDQKKKFDELLRKLSRTPQNYFYLVDVGEDDPQNYGVVHARVRERVITAKRRVSFDVTLHNYSNIPARDLPVHLVVNGDRKDALQCTLDPGSSSTVTFDYEFLEPGPYRIKFETTADFLPRDDVRYYALDVRDAVRLLLINGEPMPGYDDEMVFLQLALDPTREGRKFKIDVKTPDTLPTDELHNYDAVLMANVKDLSPEKVEKLREFVKNGGGFFIALGAKVGKEFYNQDLFEEGKGLMPARLTEIKGKEMELIERGEESATTLGKIAWDHPMFVDYAEPKNRPSLQKIPWGQYWGTEMYAEETVVAAFEDAIQSPCLIEKPFGEGKVILYTSTIDREWSNFCRIVPFVPLMDRLARHLAARPLTGRNLFLGDTIQFRFPVEKWAPELRLRHVEPGQSGERTITPDKPPKDQRWISISWPSVAAAAPPGPEKPKKASELRNEGVIHGGHYRLAYPEFKEDMDKPLAYFAVNVGPKDADSRSLEMAEANLKRIQPDALASRFPTFKHDYIGGRKSKEEGKVEIVPPASNLWKLILFAVLSLMAMESVLACIFGRKKE